MRNTIPYILAFSFMVSQSFAQDTTGIPSENVEVIKNYEASIAQASKKEMVVQLREKKYDPIQFRYSNSVPKAIDFDRPEPVIRAIAYEQKTEIEDIKDGSIYGAYGNYKTIKAGAAYHYYIEDWIEAGINIRHFSASDDAFASQKYKQSSGELYSGFYFNPTTKIRGSIYGDFSRNYTSVDTILRDHPYDRSGVKLDFSHVAFEKLGLSLRTTVGYDKIKQLQEVVNENSLYGGINLYKRINDNIAFELPFKYSRIKIKTASELVMLEPFNEMTFNPSIDVKNEKYLLKIGAQFLKGFERTILFPNIDLKLIDLFAEFDLGLSVYADIDRASMNILRQENPFASSLVINNYYGVYQYIQNYQLSLGRNFGIHNIKFASNYRRLQNEFQYQYNALVNNYSTILMDRNEMLLSLNYGVALKSGFSVDAGLQYRYFIDDNQPTYMPKWTGTMQVKKQFGSKLEMGIRLLAFAKRSFSSEDVTVQNIPANVDLAFNIKYRLSKSFNIFAESSNLLPAENYMIWYPQSVLKRHFWGGLQFNF